MMLPILIFLLPFLAQIHGKFVHDREPTDIGSFPKFLPEYESVRNDHPCRRTCVRGAPPMTCHYNFEIEYYLSMSKACYDCPFNSTDCFRPDCVPGEGTKRGIVAVNRQLPGPAIEVCLGDQVVVDIINKLTAESTTMHWHGIHQKEYAYSDGVPYVTQCPIPPQESFRYSFNASQAGTHWYHSHLGVQRTDGDFGVLVIRQPVEDDVLSEYYDYDLSSHVIVVTDWDNSLSMNKYLDHVHSSGDNKPKSLLINGLGRNKVYKKDDGNFTVPTARFTVDKGFRYRFRLMNTGVMNCPVEVSIDNHTIMLVSTDGSDVNPVEATSIVMYSGERFDVIVNANQEDGLYWVRVRGLQDCGEQFKKAFQLAVLQYSGVNATIDDYPEDVVDYEHAHADGIQINSVNKGTESNKTYISMPSLSSVAEWDDALKPDADFQYYISFDFEWIDNEDYQRAPNYGFDNFTDSSLKRATPQLNHISLKTPYFPLLPQRDEIPDGLFCNKETLKDQDCLTEECHCYHVIKFPLHSVVELVFVDEGTHSPGNHPMHLHGYSFRVVAMERMGENVTHEAVKARDAAGLIERNLIDAPLKDTVTVPDGGFTIVRFKASNPGYWILHCHLEFHVEMGMAMVVQIGENDEMLPVPDNFPKCGNYLPDV